MPRFIVIRAVARLTPRMVVHQVKRHLRNRLVPRVENLYARLHSVRVARTASIPGVANVDRELLRLIHRFYATSSAERSDALAGTFEFFGRRVEFGSVAAIDWFYRLPEEKDHHLWRMKLCQVEVMHSILSDGTEDERTASLDLLGSLRKARIFSSKDAFSTVWSPYGASHRVLALLSGLLMAEARAERPSPSDELNAVVRTFLREDVAFLSSNVEHDLRNNHTERNLAALCLYWSVAGISRRRARRMDREVRAIIESTVLRDGTQVERSAMYQGLTVMALNIFAWAPFLSAGTRSLAARRAASAADAWLFLTHADGNIALFNDSWIGETPKPEDVLGRKSTECVELPDAGYYRQTAGGFDAIFDVGSTGPNWNPGHGHADFLSVEVDCAGQRLIVDPGTSRYFTGDEREYERAAVSHNGPHFRGAEPVQYEGCFKVGKLAHAKPIRSEDVVGWSGPLLGGRLVTQAGEVLRLIAPFEGSFLIVDVWSTALPAQTRILVAGEWTCATEKDGAVFRSGTTHCRVATHVGVAAPPNASRWSRRFMSHEAATEIMIEPERRGRHQVAAWSVGPRGGEATDQLVLAAEALMVL